MERSAQPARSAREAADRAPAYGGDGGGGENCLSESTVPTGFLCWRPVDTFHIQGAVRAVDAERWTSVAISHDCPIANRHAAVEFHALHHPIGGAVLGVRVVTEGARLVNQPSLSCLGDSADHPEATVVHDHVRVRFGGHVAGHDDQPFVAQVGCFELHGGQHD